jgi:hypothetical protein
MLNNSIIPWNYRLAVNNNSISIKDIIDHPELPWEYNIMRKPIKIRNREDLIKYSSILLIPITPDVIESNPNIPWDWDILVSFCDLPFDFMLKHENKLQKLTSVNSYINPNIPVQYCINNVNDSFFASYKYNLTVRDIRDHPNFEWDWQVVSQNSNITTDDIEQNLDLPWIWSCISCNPNLTIAFIDKHIDKLSIEDLCCNEFIYDDWVSYKSMKKDSQFKHDFIVNTPGLGMLKDLAEIVADYCGFQ